MYLLVRGDAGQIPLPGRSVDLVFGSPPYIDARLYLEDGKNLGISRNCRKWVDWMFGVTQEALRVTKGAVLWVCSGNTRDRNYRPGPEGLLWRCWDAGILAECPCYWHRVGISGSGGDQWFRKDVEYVLCFKREGKLSWSDNTAMGHAPKWAPGGEMSHRVSDGTRRNQWGGTETSGRVRKRDGSRQKPERPSHRVLTAGSRRANGKRKSDEPPGNEVGYLPPDLANPGNLIKTTVGGGQMGHDAAHLNEAPFPEALAEWFLSSLCPPDGIVLDPFSGSGTTCAVAERLGRHGIGMDLRRSQADIARRRLEHPHAAVPRPGRVEHHPLFGDAP